MAILKADIETKLNKQKEDLLSNAPDFLYEYVDDYLTSISNELRSHIAATYDIINFLQYYSSIINKELKDISIADMNKVRLKDLNSYFKYITQYKVTYESSKGKEITKVRTNSLKSKARKLANLKKLFEYLHKYNLIDFNYVKDMKIKAPSESKISNRLDSETINELRTEIIEGNNIDTSNSKKSHERLSDRDLTIFLILSYTGIRISELVALDINDVNLDKCSIIVNRKNNKTQEIPFPAEINDTLEKYMIRRSKMTGISEEYKKALFISQKLKRISPDTVRKMLKKYSDRIDLKDISCHTFRRTLLYSIYNNTNDINLTAKIGGHSVMTATKYYVDVEDERLRDTMRNFKY